MPEKTTLEQVMLYLPAELLTAVDQARGEESRNRWIVEAIAERLGRPELAEELRRPGRPKNQPEECK